MSTREARRAQRIKVNIPTVVEVVGQRRVQLHPALEAVYERVHPSEEKIGERFPGIIRDLSTNGAFISGPALPLLSRVAFTFPLEGHGQVDVLAWTLWRRREACQIPREEGGDPIELEAGFGVLFEAIPLEARRAIAKLVATQDP